MIPRPFSRAFQLALYAWTAQIQRARDEYRTHPTAACQRGPCDRLATDDRYCDMHRAEVDATNNAAKARRKARR